MIKIKTSKNNVEESKKFAAEKVFGMISGADSDNEYVYEKYLKIKDSCVKVSKLFDIFKSCILELEYFQKYKSEISDFTEKYNVILKLFCADISDKEYDQVLKLNQKKYKLTDEQLLQPGIAKKKLTIKDIYSARFLGFKNSQEIKELIFVCNNLAVLKKYYEEKDNTQQKQYNIKKIALDIIIDFCPFNFSKLNIKNMFLFANMEEKELQIFFGILHKLYDNCYIIYDLVTSPDVDPKILTEVILSGLKDLRKHPKLNKCEEAFKHIEESAGLMQSNLKNYYRDFLKTQDQTTIFENFMLDVVKNIKKTNKKSSVIPAQFKKIINFIREQQQMSGKKKNPVYSNMFDILDKMSNLGKMDDNNEDVGENINEDISDGIEENIEK